MTALEPLFEEGRAEQTKQNKTVGLHFGNSDPRRKEQNSGLPETNTASWWEKEKHGTTTEKHTHNH